MSFTKKAFQFSFHSEHQLCFCFVVILLFALINMLRMKNNWYNYENILR